MISEVWHYGICSVFILGRVDIHVGKRLNALRVRQGLSPADVGDVLSVSQRQIERFEAGHARPSARQLFILAKLFDVSVASFFDQREALV